MRIHLWGELGFYGPGRRGRFEVTLGRRLQIRDALREIGVPEAEIAVTGLNGEVVRLDDPTLAVGDDDRLDLFPPSSGGAGRPAGDQAGATADQRQRSRGRSSQATTSAPTGRSASGGMKTIPLAAASEASM